MWLSHRNKGRSSLKTTQKISSSNIHVAQSLMHNFTFYLKVEIICSFTNCMLLKATSPKKCNKRRQNRSFGEVLIEHFENLPRESDMWNKSCLGPSSRAECYPYFMGGSLAFLETWEEHTQSFCMNRIMFSGVNPCWPQLIVSRFIPNLKKPTYRPGGGQGKKMYPAVVFLLDDSWPNQPEPSFRESGYET